MLFFKTDEDLTYMAVTGDRLGVAWEVFKRCAFLLFMIGGGWILIPLLLLGIPFLILVGIAWLAGFRPLP